MTSSPKPHIAVSKKGARMDPGERLKKKIERVLWGCAILFILLVYGHCAYFVATQ